MIGSAALRSEVLNLRSTPTARLLLIGSMVMAAVSLLANLAVFDTAELAERATIEQVMHASTVATMTFALLAGVVGSTSDYRFGRSDQLLLSDPRPGAVLATKAIAGSLLGVLYGLAGGAVAVVVTWAYYRSNDAAIDLTSQIVVRPLIGVVIAGALFAAVGVGLGTAIRNQPAAIVASLAALLVVQPPLLLGLPAVGRWLPGAAGLALTLAPDTELLGQAMGAVVLFAWAGIALWLGNHRFKITGA